MTRTVIFRRESTPDRLAIAKQRTRVLRAMARIGRPATAADVTFLTGMGGVAGLLEGLAADGLVTATPGAHHHHGRDHATTYYEATAAAPRVA